MWKPRPGPGIPRPGGWAAGPRELPFWKHVEEAASPAAGARAELPSTTSELLAQPPGPSLLSREAGAGGLAREKERKGEQEGEGRRGPFTK